MTRRNSASPRKDEATGTWCFVVDLGPGPDGNRRQARRRGFATRREAQEALDRLRVNAREGTYVALHQLTLAAYLDSWLETMQVAGKAVSTLASYRRNVRVHVVPAVGGLRLQALTAAHLDHLYARLLADGRRDGGGGLKPRTVRYVHTIIRKALSDARRKGLITRNVADDATPPSAKASRAPEMCFWTPGQLRQFLAATAGDEHAPLWRLVSMTGMRVGEVCGLRWETVDLDGSRLEVRRQLTLSDGKVIEVEHTKTDRGRRAIDLDGTTVAALRVHRRRQHERRLAFGAGWQDHGLVFCGADGRPLRPDAVSRTFVRQAGAAGVPRIRFHDIRHTHVAHLLAAGRNPLEVSRRLGHASPSFTLDRYGHLMPEAGSEAATAVAALVDG